MIGIVAILVLGTVAVVLVDRQRVARPAVDVSPSSGGMAWPVLRELARVEGRRLWRHPLVWLGAALVVSTFPYGSQGWQLRWGLSGVWLNVLAWGGFVAVHTAVARHRRAGDQELMAALPAGARTRAWSHIASVAWLLGPAAVLWAGVTLRWLGPDLAHTIVDGEVTYVWRAHPLELLQGLVALAIVLLLAVAVGTWWAHPMAAIVVPLLLFFSPAVWMLSLTWEAGVVLPYGTGKVVDTGLLYIRWHYLFLAGLLVATLAGTLIRHGSRRLWSGLMVGGLAAAVAGFLLRMHPWS